MNYLPEKLLAVDIASDILVHNVYTLQHRVS